MTKNVVGIRKMKADSCRLMISIPKSFRLTLFCTLTLQCLQFTQNPPFKGTPNTAHRLEPTVSDTHT